ncbi:DUF4286 domain-containing protein [Pontibacter korlensis]|uniref:DUF4286 domain-containing protein n=1 Tax=Pontibacter korlensis TaxID=400092 RepID=A0A0E3ZE57_9BACT|nr:DUF4286 family protein [Pontibacter korlensis]AKD02690.1 hypothetical protein PKOR_05575 [Pontibacter korlensis]
MILYNETVSVDNTVADEWLQWMKEVHIPTVMETGFFLSNQISRLMHEVANDGTTYAVQYTCRSLDDLEEYQREHASEIDSRHDQRYQGKYVVFRSMLEVVAKDVERK